MAKKSRNPLTGLSGLQQVSAELFDFKGRGRNPLTGLSGLQQLWVVLSDSDDVLESQSPYGAKWFATKEESMKKLELQKAVAIPLRG